jgi:integrase
MGEQRRVDGRVFGQRNLHTANTAGHAVDLITTLEAFDTGTDLLDNTGQVDTEDCRERIPCVCRGARADLGIQRIDAARANPDENLACARPGTRNIGQTKFLGRGGNEYGRPSQSEKPTVRGGRAKNTEYRQREYLTEAEVAKLVAAAGESRNPVRDRLLILMAFRHALRVSELVDIRWQQIHLDTATVDIRRAKNGTPGIHGLQGDELRLLRALRREHPHADFVFLSERKAPLSVDGAQKLIERLGEAAELPFPIHAHMLRHAAGYALAARGVDTRTLQAFMGHRSIANTVIYTSVADKRIRNIWGK